MSRMNVGARQGLINKLARGKKMSSTKGDNKGKPATYRVACSMCDVKPSTQYPDGCVYVYVGSRSKTATCRNGHTFPIGRSPNRGPKPSTL